MTDLGQAIYQRAQRETAPEDFLRRLEDLAFAQIESGTVITAESFEGYSISGVPAAMPRDLLGAINEARRELDGAGSGAHDFSGCIHRT